MRISLLPAPSGFRSSNNCWHVVRWTFAQLFQPFRTSFNRSFSSHSAARYNKWRVIGGYISSGRRRCDAGVSGYRTSSTTCNVATWGQRLHLFEEGRIEGARERWVGFPSPSSAAQFRFEFISTPARHMINWLLARVDRGRVRSRLWKQSICSAKYEFGETNTADCSGQHQNLISIKVNTIAYISTWPNYIYVVVILLFICTKVTEREEASV